MGKAANSLDPDIYLKAIEGSDSGLWVCDIQKGLCFLSNKYYTMLGYEPGEFEGTMANLFGLLHPDDVEKSNKFFAEFFAGKSLSYRNEVRLKTKQGTYLPILTQGLAERNEKGEVVNFIGWNIDISSLKDAQRKLDEERAVNVAQSRLAQLGLLAGGLAHEVNNPLTVIQLRSEMLLKSLQKGADITGLHQGLANIRDAAVKISEIIKGLQTFSSGGAEGNKVNLSLSKVVEEVLTVCNAEILSKNIRLHTDFTQEDQTVFANGALLGQVFLNLIKNAIDALEAEAQKDIWIKITSNQQEVLFIIEDNGPGISPEQQDQIMLPFYTTKEPGKGTGLGLSISRSIIRSLEGDICFESKNGLTRFEVKLPLAKSR